MLEPSTPNPGMSQQPIDPTANTFTTLLGIDFGLKRIGLAIGQTVTATATPIKTIATPNPLSAIALEAIIKEWQPQAIIIGYPLHADNQETQLCQTIRQFGEQLKQHFNLPIHYENEYLSSAEAQAMIKSKRQQGMLKHKTQKSDIDQYAAALILQRWLDTQHNEH